MDNSKPSSVPHLLRSRGIRPSRYRGQNFLTDPGLLERIASFAGGRPTLEIGAGVGNLTVHLAAHADIVVAVEIDSRLHPILERSVGEMDNVKVIQADFLDCNLEEILSEREKWACVSNLPYSVSSPVLFHLLGSVDLLSDIYLSLQMEVAERLVAEPGSKVYGRLTVMAGLLTDAKILFRISRKAFFPRPQVESAFVHLRPHDRFRAQVRSQPVLEDLVRAAFGQRRKKLINALRPAFANRFGQDDLLLAFEEAGIDPGSRAEAVDSAGFVALANRVAERLGSGEGDRPD
jgi:16S rRNA (adenine1518-N6/adenine1519-N6)-dimethyltransferase